jgi:hypothetical protein
VEGYEPQALRSAAKLLGARRVNDILLEYSPGIPERLRTWADILPFPRMLLALKGLRYTIVDIEAGRRGPELMNWESPLPEFKEVTEGNLKHDVDDVLAMVMQTLACPLPPKLTDMQRARKSDFGFCNAIPEDLHPKSFRSMFSHNTNVWASLGSKEMRKGEPVGVLPWAQSLQDYFVPEGQEFGMSHRICADMPAKVLVRHRCRWAAAAR